MVDGFVADGLVEAEKRKGSGMTATKPDHRQNSKSQFADDTAVWAASKNIQFAAKLLRKDLRNLAKWCVK